MTSVAGMQLDSSLELGERITELFPKCRALGLRLTNNEHNKMDNKKPRDRLECDEEADDASASAVDTSDEESNDSDKDTGVAPAPLPSPSQSPATTPGHDNQVLVLGKGAAYKLRDSRIIEIAGGREVFCQSRSKAARKGRHLPRERDDAPAATAPAASSGRVWELRSRCGEAKRQRSADVSRARHRAANASRKLGSHVYEPVPLSMSGGEVVVFDDIGENWRGNASSSAATTPSPPGHHRAPSHYFKVSTSVSDAENDSLSPDREDAEDLGGGRSALGSGGSGGGTRKGARIIGGLPIADYEGSPRRYGPRQGDPGSQGSHPALPSAHSLLSSPSLLTPRPGFPQRILPDRNSSPPTSTASTNNSTFDYLYEFSETRKVLEEFFKPSTDVPNNEDNSHFQELEYELRRQAAQNTTSCSSGAGSAYVGLRLAKAVPEHSGTESPNNEVANVTTDLISLQEQPEVEQENNLMELSTGSGSTEDLGDTEVGLQVGHSRNFTLSPETTDCDSNCGDLDSEVSLLLTDGDTPGSLTQGLPVHGLTSGLGTGLSGGVGDIGSGLPVDAMRLYSSMPVLEDGLSSGHASDTDNNNPTVLLMKRQISEIERELNQRSRSKSDDRSEILDHLTGHVSNSNANSSNNANLPGRERDNSYPDPELEALDPLAQWCSTGASQSTPPPPAPAPHRSPDTLPCRSQGSTSASGEVVEEVIKDIRLALQRAKTLPVKSVESEPPQPTASPIWVPRKRNCDSDMRRTTLSGDEHADDDEADTDLETDRLLGQLRTDDIGYYEPQTDKEGGKKKGRNKEVLIEGVLFRARYLGSTQLVCEGQPTKTTRMMQAEEAVSRIKAPDGETQPSTEVDLFISTEKIMVLNTDLKEIMMDHALRTISYIADIGDLVVLMARRRFMPQDDDSDSKLSRTPKMICHVFQSEEAQFIAQSIGQAFQVAYMEFLKANGIEDNSFVKEMDYQEVLNSQEIFGDELQMFAKKEMQKEVVVPKAKGEILGVVIVESGWGSMLPTVVIANLAPAGAAARCGQLNIGDQIIAINGVSLVGLPLSTCQNYIKNTKTQTVVKLTVVPCAPVVEVKIKRPETKYQLGFSVQNGVICSLLRGGIAERGGVRVGHRIIEINNQSVVAVPHEKIVNLLATSVGEILMKTMPTSMFRLLTGQETPIYI